jgi:hypothetical protein
MREVIPLNFFILTPFHLSPFFFCSLILHQFIFNSFNCIRRSNFSFSERIKDASQAELAAGRYYPTSRSVESDCDVTAISHVLVISHVVAVGNANSLVASQVISISIYRALSSRREYSLFLPKKALLHTEYITNYLARNVQPPDIRFKFGVNAVPDRRLSATLCHDDVMSV